MDFFLSIHHSFLEFKIEFKKKKIKTVCEIKKRVINTPRIASVTTNCTCFGKKMSAAPKHVPHVGPLSTVVVAASAASPTQTMSTTQEVGVSEHVVDFQHTNKTSLFGHRYPVAPVGFSCFSFA